MSDTDILLNAYLGTDFAQSITAELGEEVVSAIWLNGFSEAQAIHIRSQQQIIESNERVMAMLKRKEAA